MVDAMIGATRPRWRLGYEERSAMLFLAPVMVVLGAVAAFPILYSLYISFFSVKLTRPNRTPFVGLKNYTDLLGDATFWSAVWRRVSFLLEKVPGAYGWIGNGSAEGGRNLHSPHYDFNDEILPLGVQFFVEVARCALIGANE
nr:hypothetical protein [Thioclava sp.]